MPTRSGSTGDVSIRFENVQSAVGYIQVALYDSAEGFMQDDRAKLYTFKVEGTGTVQVKLPNLPHGRYAFAAFHDLDSNNELGTNFFGIPTEPYGFSRPDVSKWRPPTFAEAAFTVGPVNEPLTVVLDRWKP